MFRPALVVAALSAALTTVPAAACGPAGCVPGGCSMAGSAGAGSAGAGVAGVVGMEGNYYFTALLHAKQVGLSAAQVAELTARDRPQRTKDGAIQHQLDSARTRLQAVITLPGANEPQVEQILGEMRALTSELRASAIASGEAGQQLLTPAQRDHLGSLVSGEPVTAATPPPPATTPES
ncbi:MAG: hypothetical protein GW783_06125 [Deltaproteobacteria bacterium]|nr:hypothetical protein [Deltaproteobacteria bacterium]NCS73684.1 hypothetical protein [Deltaproteobacteria bacterium]